MTSVQQILDVATSANATTLGTGEAAKNFRTAFEASVKCRIQLKAEDRNYLSRIIQFPIVFTNEQVVTHDHPILAALREIARDVYEKCFKISKTNVRTLVVGAAAREIKKYYHNPFIHYYVHGKENKDYDRTIRTALGAIAKTIKAKAHKKNTKVFLPKPEDVDTSIIRPVFKRYKDFESVMKDWNDTNKLPCTIHPNLVEAEVLLFEDSLYNFDYKMICDTFKQTNANVAYGYMLLPMELLYPEMPENRLYRFNVVKNSPIPGDNDNTDFIGRGNFATVAELTFRNGYSNGYRHKLSNWKTLLASPAYSWNGVNIAIEIMHRAGPMVVFKIYRCHHPESIVRTIELTENESYVKLLDLYGSMNHRTCKLDNPLKYFSVKESEFWEGMNYISRIDEKSWSIQNVMLYVCRRAGGMSLQSKEFVGPWDLPKSKYYQFSVAVYLQAMITNNKVNFATDEAARNTAGQRVAAFFRAMAKAVCFPIVECIEALFAERLTDKVVLFPQGGCSMTQRMNIMPRDIKFESQQATLAMDFANEDNTTRCPFCNFMHTPINDDPESTPAGKQKFVCDYKIDSNHTFELSTQQINDILVKLMDDDDDAPGLAGVKQKAKELFPKAAFQHTCRVELIIGGPGTGKSYTIRSMADITSLILAPFTKLKPDYMDVKSVDGNIDLVFKTQHRAMSETGHSVIFVDEFTSFPYEFLAAAAYLNKCEVIYLVGDERQTRLQEPTEGMYIGNHIKLGELSTHEMTENFRNPQDVVDILNAQFGYKMNCQSRIKHSIQIIGPKSKLPTEGDMVKMAFSHASAENNVQDKKATVRSNQGGTFTNALLYCTAADGALPMMDSMAIVSISRAKEKLYIYVDGSDVSRNYISKLGISLDWVNVLETHSPLTNEQFKVIVVAQHPETLNKTFDSFHAWEKSGKDAHLLADTFAPHLVTDTEMASLNEVQSQVVADNFRTAKVNPDELANPVNIRGHPEKNEDSFYSLGPGYGLNYTGKLPFQELGVIVERYDTVKRTFPFDADRKKLAEDMVDYYISECKVSVPIDKILNDFVMQDKQDEFLRVAIQKKYPQRFRGEGEGYAKTIHFFLKSTLKVINSMKDFKLEKPGQGISAWSAEANSEYCLMWRFLQYLDLATDRKDSQVAVLSDQGLEESAFLEEVMNVTAALHGSNLSIIKNGITDQEKFDSNQDENTQYLEWYYWYKLGVNAKFLDVFYDSRRNYTIYGRYAVAKPKYEKTSGGPETLVNNGVVAKVTSNWVIRGKGPMVVMSKGDDFNKSQLDLHIDETAMAQLKTWSPLRFTVKISDNGEFCGYLVTSSGLIPNPIRRVWKIMGCRWRNYKHFCEYQKSLRDYVRMIKSVGKMKCIVGCMMTYKVTTQEAEAAIEYIESVSHLSEEQWKQQVKFHVVRPSIPVQNDDVVNDGKVEIKQM